MNARPPTEARRPGAARRLLRLAQLLWLLALVPAFAPAAVPHEDAVPAYSAEQTILQVEQDTPQPGWLSTDSGRRHMERHFLGSTIREPDVILQRGGNTWRTWRNGPVATMSAALLLGMPLVIALFHWRVGPQKLEGSSGRDILRFRRGERVVHWAMAVVFVLLALTGLLILFGKKLLIPYIGHDAFSAILQVGKWVHNLLGPVFTVLTVLMLVMWWRDNVPRRHDWQWVRAAGGLFTGKHIPAGRFNAGEKAWFWGAVAGLGLIVSVTGFVLDFVNFDQSRYVLQWANMLHLVSTVLYMTGLLGHAYIGSLGNEGAWRAMRHGVVDEEWARQHHELWLADLEARGRDGATPAAATRHAPPARPHPQA